MIKELYKISAKVGLFTNFPNAMFIYGNLSILNALPYSIV